MSEEQLEVWPAGEGRWRWTYRGPGEGDQEIEFDSHKEYLSAQEARHAATTAYRDAPVVQLPESPIPRPRQFVARAAVLWLVLKRLRG